MQKNIPFGYSLKPVETQMELLDEVLANRDSMSLREMRDILVERTGRTLSLNSLVKILSTEGYTTKHKNTKELIYNVY